MDRRRAILDSSLKLIEEKGLDALSMREVARSLQVTHGAPYYHFPDRSVILAALVEEGLVVLTQELENAAKAHADPRAAFEACGPSYVEFALTHGAYFRVMFRYAWMARSPRKVTHENLRKPWERRSAHCWRTGRHWQPVEFIAIQRQ